MYSLFKKIYSIAPFSIRKRTVPRLGLNPLYRPNTMNSDINMYLGREKTSLMRKRALLLRKGCSFEITR